MTENVDSVSNVDRPTAEPKSRSLNEDDKKAISEKAKDASPQPAAMKIAGPTPDGYQQSKGPSSIQLKVPWRSQFNDPKVQSMEPKSRLSMIPGYDRFIGSKIACYKGVRAMADDVGVKLPAVIGDNKIQVANREDDKGRVETTREQTDRARSFIDSELNQGRPVAIGMSYKSNGNWNKDGITDHYLLVTGRGTEPGGRPFYTYNDPAARNAEEGTNRKLYVDPKSGNLVRDGPFSRTYSPDVHAEMSIVIKPILDN
jgi:hypothetical protein